VALVFFAGAVRAEPEQPLRIGGTGGALAAMRQLADAFAEQDKTVRPDVLPSLGSGGGVRAMVEGAIEVAAVGRPLTDAEQAAGAAPAVCWRVPFVFVTSHPVVFDLSKIEAGQFCTPSWSISSRCCVNVVV
jgi:phosphate transport system substrate-binding protein